MKSSIPLILAAATVAAAEPAAPTPGGQTEVEALRAQVEALAKTVGALKQQLEAQEARWEGFNAPASAALGGPSSEAFEALQGDVEALKNAQEQTRPGLLNPELSAAVDFITSYSKAANQWSFTPRDVELMVQANADAFARAYVVLNAETELAPAENRALFEETSVKLEEAAIETTSLPWGLQLRAGQFFADFTRLGKVHSHDLPFVDRPLSLEGIIGGETVARGFELNWVPPLPHYMRLTAGLVDNIGAELPVTARLEEEGSAFAEQANRPLRSLTAYARGATQFEIGQGGVLRLGADYAHANRETRRQIASADAKFEWQPNPARYDLFETGAEALWTRQSGTLSGEAAPGGSREGSASAYGGYAYAQYRFGKQWQPGVRLDYLHADTFQEPDGDDPFKLATGTWTTSAYLTFHWSETNRLRLQLSYLNGSEGIVPGKGHSDLQAFFQWTVLFGPHKHPFNP